MPVEVIMPRVDMDMTEAKIARWLKREGDPVKAGETVFEIETDKAAMEIEAPAAGILRGLSAAEGETVPVGKPVAWIYADGEEPAPSAPRKQADGPKRKDGVESRASDASGEPPPASPAPPQFPSSQGEGRRATPKARRLARERGINLGLITGRGPRGRIQADDIPARAAAVSGRALPRLHIEQRAGDSVPAVFIHGFGAELSIWKATLAALPPGLATAAIDLPAHGRSGLGGLRSFEDIAAAVAASLADAGIGRCHLVGHSFGGLIALAIAAEGLLDVRSLMLISPAGLGPDIEREFLEGFTRATRVESLTPWLRLLFARPSLVTPAFARAIMRGRDSETLREQQRRIADSMFPDGTQANDLRTALDRLAMPCKVLWGRQDRIIPVTHTANLPGHVGLHLLAETGHVPHLEQPALVARLIGELVTSAG